MTRGRFSLTGGFWALYALQAPGAPVLKIFLTTTNTVVISWPSPSLGWGLQETTTLSPASWVAPLESINDNSIERFIVVDPPAGNRFYRLSKP